MKREVELKLSLLQVNTDNNNNDGKVFYKIHIVFQISIYKNIFRFTNRNIEFR